MLLAVANARPVEPIHLGGVQDGGDYDSLIQPLVLMLAGLPVTPVPLLTPLRPSPVQLPSQPQKTFRARLVGRASPAPRQFCKPPSFG